MQLGDLFKEARKKKEFTLEQCADILGISYKHLSSIERGSRNPSTELLLAAAQKLDICLTLWIHPTDNPLLNQAWPLLNNRTDAQLRLLIALLEAMEKEDSSSDGTAEPPK